MKSKKNTSRVGLNYADVTGYICDGDLYCLRHGDEDCDPIFAGSEWDYQPHCSICGDEIDVVVLTHRCECEDENCRVDHWGQCKDDGTQRLYRVDGQQPAGVWVCDDCAQDMIENSTHSPERPTQQSAPRPSRKREYTEQEKKESLRRLGVPSELERSGLPSWVDPDAIERALHRGRGSDDEVLGVPRKKKVTRSKKNHRVGEDPEEMTPGLAQYRAQERGFPSLVGSQKDIADGLVRRELAAQIFDHVKRVEDWGGTTAPQKKRYAELAKFRINDVESSFQELTNAKDWSRNRAMDAYLKRNYSLPGGILRLQLIWNTNYPMSFVLTQLPSVMFTQTERNGSYDRKITAVKAMEAALEPYRRKHGVGRRNRVGAKYPSETTISPRFMRHRYSDFEAALASNDPNTSPQLLEEYASYYPEIVRQNIAIPLLDLEDPGRARRIQNKVKDALRSRKDQEIMRVDDRNLNVSSWLAKEEMMWAFTLLERFEENLYDSRSLPYEDWPSPDNLNDYIDEDDWKHFRSQFKERWGGALSQDKTQDFFDAVLKGAHPLAQEAVKKFAEKRGITISGRVRPSSSKYPARQRKTA